LDNFIALANAIAPARETAEAEALQAARHKLAQMIKDPKRIV
jgi:hypothetical protein